MKHLVKFYFLPFLVLTVSCKKEMPPQNEAKSATPVAEYAVSPQLEKVVAEYYNNLKALTYATTNLADTLKKVSLRSTAANHSDNELYNEIVTDNVTDFETGEPVSILNMPLEERIIFMEKYFEAEKDNFLKDLKIAPAFAEGMEEMNAMNREIFKKLGLSPVTTPVSSANLRYLATSGNGGYKKINYADYKKELEQYTNSGERENELRKKDDERPWLLGSLNNQLKNSFYRRGDFLLTLPYGKKVVLLWNPFAGFQVGHAGVLTSNWWTTNEFETIEASKDIINYRPSGVQLQKNNPQWTKANTIFVMGMCHYTKKWKWKWFKSHFLITKTPVSNHEALADWAVKNNYKPYVSFSEHLHSKNATPASFTCTSLVWWSAKKAYGFNIAHFSPFITPNHLKVSKNTYVKKQINL